MYNLQKTSNEYRQIANSPVLDKVVFTIDHIHMGGDNCPSTLDTVKMLTDFGIPVTVFMECIDPKNEGALDKKNASEIFDLNPDLVSLGIHSLKVGNSQLKQSANLDLIAEVIQEITGNIPRILSYHGRNAGPEVDISYKNIEFARGIHCDWSVPKRDNLLNTPVMPMNNVDRAYKYTSLRNNAGLSSTVFTHTAEMKEGSTKKLVFDTFVNEVVDRRLQAIDYHSAMKNDYYNLQKKAG